MDDVSVSKQVNIDETSASVRRILPWLILLYHACNDAMQNKHNSAVKWRG